MMNPVALHIGHEKVLYGEVNNMTELKCCPFCGGEAFDCPDDSYGTGFIGCGGILNGVYVNCVTEVWVSYESKNKDSRQEAVATWNTRIVEIT